MNAMNVQDIVAVNVALAGRAMMGRTAWKDAASVFVAVLPDAKERVDALRRLVEAIETYQGASLLERNYPARAVSAWLGDPSRDRIDVASVFRLALVEAAHA